MRVYKCDGTGHDISRLVPFCHAKLKSECSVVQFDADEHDDIGLAASARKAPEDEMLRSI